MWGNSPRVRIPLSPPFIFPLPISGKKRIFYSKALKVVGVKGFAQIAEVCLKHTHDDVNAKANFERLSEQEQKDFILWPIMNLWKNSDSIIEAKE